MTLTQLKKSKEKRRDLKTYDEYSENQMILAFEYGWRECNKKQLEFYPAKEKFKKDLRHSSKLPSAHTDEALACKE